MLSILVTLARLLQSGPIPTVRGRSAIQSFTVVSDFSPHTRHQHLRGHPGFQVPENRQVLPWACELSPCLGRIHGTIEPDVASLLMAATAGLYVRIISAFLVTVTLFAWD